ncbi:MAG: hypothetical protein AAF682_23810 [Planctomycetota bacterium]
MEGTATHGQPGKRELEAPPGVLAALGGLALVLLGVAIVWRDIAAFPFTGEDYQVLYRLGQGESAYPHVFRPLPGLWLDALHDAFGAVSARPFHVASIGLHAANAALLYLAAAALLGRRAPALVAALAFGVGAAACDAVAWIAAVNRPVSAFGALLAWNGLARWRGGSAAAPLLIAGGFAWQYFANEEVYGTALLVMGWLAWEGLRGGGAGAGRDSAARSPRTALAFAAAVGALLLAHYLFLQRVPGGADNVLAAGLAGAPWSALQRAADVLGGYGIPGVPAPLAGWVAPVFALPLLFTGARDAAGFALLAWATSFVPFALDDPVEYRAYPTLAPTALLFAGLAGGTGRALARRFGDRAELAVCVAAAVLVAFGSIGPRRARLAEWGRGGREMAACAEAVRERAARAPGELPVLVNLETSTVGVFLYHYGLDDVSVLSAVEFLDGVTGYVPPGELPPPPWFGRRVDGSYGEIEPATYFATRPVLAEVLLVGELVPAGSLDEALERLADPAVDLSRQAVAECDVAALGPRSAAGQVIELEPLVGDPVAITARKVVGVRAEEPTVLAILDTWQYSHMMRISADQLLFSDVVEGRVLRLEAHIDGAAEPVAGFPLNAYGFGVPIPAGDHTVELRWRRATPAELR